MIYPPELEVKETTYTCSSASFLDLYLEFDDSDELSTKMYDKRDEHVQQYTSFSCIWCLHLAIDSLCNYSDFLKRHLHMRNRLLDQSYKKIRLIRSLKKFIFRYQDIFEIYSVSAETIINDAFSYSENV
jgi:hypothetical protein